MPELTGHHLTMSTHEVMPALPGVKEVPALPAFSHSQTSFTDSQSLAATATTEEIQKVLGGRTAFFEALGSVP